MRQGEEPFQLGPPSGACIRENQSDSLYNYTPSLDVDDFEPLSLELVPGENMEISLVTIDDEITLEYNDTILLEFEHENYETLETIMQNNEFLREKVVVHIIDNDRELYQRVGRHRVQNIMLENVN